MEDRTESDAYGEVSLPGHAYWGPQTERARRLFAIGAERLPSDVIHAFGAQKAAAARANQMVGLLDGMRAEAIIAAAQEMEQGSFDDHFPIALWQTGSGTQTNMNANEVIANRANEILGHPLGSRRPVHPNDHVNLGQSSNDTFPTIMHVCTLRSLSRHLEPATRLLEDALIAQANRFHDHVKLGMTHLQDALPITLGMEFRTWHSQVAAAHASIVQRLPDLYDLPQGGTACGSGVNGHPQFATQVAHDLGVFVGAPLRAGNMPSQMMAAHDGFVGLCGALNVLASALLKICNDVRLLTSSLGGKPALMLPDEGLSSSIMPAKRNATVCEAVIQACLRVMGNSGTVLAANGIGALQLNTCKPLILNEVINSIRLLSDAQRVLAEGCILGLTADASDLRQRMECSPVLGTLVAPVLGYDAAAQVVRDAAMGRTVRELVAERGTEIAKAFDEYLCRTLNPDLLDRQGAGFTPEPTENEGR